MIDFSSGYIFDQFYFEGESFNDQGNNRVDVGNGAFLSLQFRTRW